MKIINKFAVNLFYFLSIFLLIFGPMFNSVGTWFDIILIYAALISVFGFLFYRIQLNKIYFQYFILIPLSIYIFLHALSQSYELTDMDILATFFRPIRILLTMLGCYSVSYTHLTLPTNREV